MGVWGIKKEDLKIHTLQNFTFIEEFNQGFRYTATPKKNAEKCFQDISDYIHFISNVNPRFTTFLSMIRNSNKTYTMWCPRVPNYL